MSECSTYLDGRIEVLIDRQEMRMSQWVESPKVVDTRSGEVMLDLHGSTWDLVRASALPDGLALELRRYPGSSPSIELTLTLGQPGGTLGGERYDPRGLLAALENHA